MTILTMTPFALPKPLIKALTVVPVFVLAACNSSDDSTAEPSPAPPQAIALNVDFNGGDHGWTAGFSDYPVADADNFELTGRNNHFTG